MDSETLFLTKAVKREIIAHAQEGKPEEVCGILWGRGARACGLVRGRNVAPDPIRDYEIDTQTLLRQFEFEEDGDEMVAIYHSHPVSPAYPSASDAWSAHYPDCAYIICSLKDDKALDTIAGISYDSCCWSIQLLGQSRIQNSTSDDASFDNSILIQFVFKGLGSLSGSKARNTLTQSIPGYEDTLQ